MDLQTLLAAMSPAIRDGAFVFCTIPSGTYGDGKALRPLASVEEAEGLTLVVPKDRADADGLSYGPVLRCITLTVHSSLSAVGLTAAVSGRLASLGISANVIAGYYHDHVFVPAEHAAAALAALEALAEGHCTEGGMP